MKPTAKQRAVLMRLAKGQNYEAAYRAEGLSEYGANRATFLMRLVDSGFVTLHTDLTALTKEDS